MENNQSEKFRASPLWEKLNNGLFKESHSIDLSTFRSAGTLNEKLAHWGPYDGSTRYYKIILMNLVNDLTVEENLIYKNCENTNLGGPNYVEKDNVKFNLDYVLSTLEVSFIKNTHVSFKSVCEIGAGFGRTAHAMINNFDLESYTIIDLPNCLNISRKYLKEVLSSEKFSKITFLTHDDSSIENVKADLFINIDSFAEMEEVVVKNYLDIIKSGSKYFYIKNPVCKYTPEMVGILNYNEVDVKNALKLGLCREVKNIFNENELIEARESYYSVYKPSKDFKLINSSPAKPVSYYQNALFEKV